MYSYRQPISTSSSNPWSSPSPDPTPLSHSTDQSSSNSTEGYTSDGNNDGDLSSSLTPPRPARLKPVLSYFQAYTPLSVTMLSGGNAAQVNGSGSGDDSRPGKPGRRMSKARINSVDDVCPTEVSPTATRQAQKPSSRSSSSKDAGQSSKTSASRPSATRSVSSSRDASGHRSDRLTAASSSSGRHSSQQRITTSSSGKAEIDSYRVRKTRSNTLGSIESQTTGTSSPRGNVTFADPSAAAAKLRAVTGSSGDSTRPAGPTRSASATSPPRANSTSDSRRLHKPSSSSPSAAQRTGRLSDFAMLRGEGRGPPEISAVTASTNAIERRIFLDAHEREKDRMQQQQDFMRERQRTLLKELEVTKALPGLLKGEKPPKSKEDLEREERHRREKASGLRPGPGYRETSDGGSRSQRPPSPKVLPASSTSVSRTRPSPTRSKSAVTPAGTKLGQRLSGMSDVSTRSRDNIPPPLSKREQLNIRTIDEIIKTGLDREVLLHAPNPRPPRSAFAPSPSTTRFPPMDGALERTESDSSVSELDSGTEEASRTVYLRDGKPLSWGWNGSQQHPQQKGQPSVVWSSPRLKSAASSHDFHSDFAPAPVHKSSIASIYTASSTSTVHDTGGTLSHDAFGPPIVHKEQKSQPVKADDHDHNHVLAIGSPKLTRLVALARAPYKGHIVSLSDVGAPDGHPVVVFLGLGGVRYLTALYDNLAQSMGLRLICIDRFGLGRSDDVREDDRGFLPWAGVVEEVADQLGLGCFSVLAHSAGSPFAMAACLRLGRRVHGSVHLLAPWVGLEVDGGYKWLRYIPAGVIKTAQMAEWKMQGWMLGKPASPNPSAIPPVDKVSAAGSISRRTSSSSSPTSAYSVDNAEDVPEDALAYMGLCDRSSPPLVEAPSTAATETTEYPSTTAPERGDFAATLLRACHAENRGGTADLLAIMRKSSEWGFAYTDVTLPVKVWYGDRDEKINEKSVRWLERELAHCTLVIKKGEGHNLLSSMRVIIEVLESIAAEAGRA